MSKMSTETTDCKIKMDVAPGFRNEAEPKVSDFQYHSVHSVAPQSSGSTDSSLNWMTAFLLLTIILSRTEANITATTSSFIKQSMS